MRISSIETFLLEAAIEPGFGWSQGWKDRRDVGLVKLTSDDGVVGWGEGLSGPSARLVHEGFAPLLLGADPMQRNGLWQRMFQTLYNGNDAVGIGGSAMSAVDIALWDIAEKQAGCRSRRSSADACGSASPSTRPASTIRKRASRQPPTAGRIRNGCWTRPACTWSWALRA